MNLLRFLLQTSRRVVVWATIASVVSGAGSALLLAAIQGKLNGTVARGVALPVLGFVLVAAVVLFGKVASAILTVKLSQRAVTQLRMSLAARVLRTPLRQLEELGAARLLSILTDDVAIITEAVVALVALGANVCIIVACLAYLCWMSGTLFAAFVVALVLCVGSYAFLLRRAKPFLVRAREAQDRLFQHFRAVAEGVKELKLNRERRTWFSGSLEEASRRHESNMFAGLSMMCLAGAWAELLLFAIIGVLLYLPLLQDSDARTKTGFALTILYIGGPMVLVLRSVQVLSRASVSLRKIEGLAHALPTVDSKGVSDVPTTLRERLEMVGVTHAYHRENQSTDDTTAFVLGPIHFDIQMGEHVFIIGGNGSGKSTLVKLIAGLYTPEGGQVFLDRIPVTEENREWYRQHFSAIFADFFLFERLVSTTPSTVDTQARLFLSKLHLDNVVSVRDGAFSTIALSQGQRKRLALLAAYLEDRSIYIFDEWAADQDPYFKEIFYTQLLPGLKARGKTALVVTHDDRYFSLADRIIKIENGQILKE